LPPAVPVNVSQESFDVAVQEHVEVVVTSTLEEPAPGPAGMVNGATVYEQAAAAWLTVNVWPATVSVPARGVVSVLAATENCTVTLPGPAAPAAMDTHQQVAVR